MHNEQNNINVCGCVCVGVCARARSMLHTIPLHGHTSDTQQYTFAYLFRQHIKTGNKTYRVYRSVLMKPCLFCDTD